MEQSDQHWHAIRELKSVINRKQAELENSNTTHQQRVKEFQQWATRIQSDLKDKTAELEQAREMIQTRQRIQLHTQGTQTEISVFAAHV